MSLLIFYDLMAGFGVMHLVSRLSRIFPPRPQNKIQLPYIRTPEDIQMLPYAIVHLFRRRIGTTLPLVKAKTLHDR